MEELLVKCIVHEILSKGNPAKGASSRLIGSKKRKEKSNEV